MTPHGFDERPQWPGTGHRVLDTSHDRVGVVQMFRDSKGSISGDQPRTDVVVKVLLRPVREGVPWWAEASALTTPGTPVPSVDGERPWQA